MSGCLELDVLVSVGRALEWSTDRALRHLADCEACRERMHQLAVVHQTVAAELQPEPGFADSVMQSLPRDTLVSEPTGNRFGVPALISTVLAAATTFFVIALAGSYAAPLGGGMPVLFASLLVAAGTLLWNWRYQTSAERV